MARYSLKRLLKKIEGKFYDAKPPYTRNNSCKICDDTGYVDYQSDLEIECNCRSHNKKNLKRYKK